jgi:hypothetical protein
MSIRPSAKNYLDANLKPLFQDINVSTTSSYLLSALGYGSIGSTQSFVIQAGTRLETFWNKVINDSVVAENLISDDDTIVVEGEETKTGKQKKRQIDGCFKVGGKFYYREFKCNLTFDSEKKPASEAKITQVEKLISQKYENVKVDSGYIVPCIIEPTPEITKQSTVSINGVKWLIELIETENLFTAEEFMEYFNNDLSVIFKTKMGW